MLELAFWKATGERVIRTFAATLAGLLVADPVAGIVDVDWGEAMSISVLSAVVTLLVIVSAGAATKDSRPSISRVESITRR